MKEQGIGSTGAFLAETLLKLIDEGKIRIPRGGYLVTRGRGWVEKRVVAWRPLRDIAEAWPPHYLSRGPQPQMPVSGLLRVLQGLLIENLSNKLIELGENKKAARKMPTGGGKCLALKT